MKLLLSMLWCAGNAFAAQVCFGGAALGDGIPVEFALHIDGGRGRERRELCKVEEGKGYVRRILPLAGGRALGYELHVKRNGPPRPPFHVSVQPVQSRAAGYFPRDPGPVEVAPGDTVEFVLLENRQGSLRLFERFRIRNARAGGYAPPGLDSDIDPSKPHPPAGTLVHLMSPAMTRDGAFLGSAKAGVRGSLVWVWVPGKGRFWFSSTERGRFRRVARAQRHSDVRVEHRKLCTGVRAAGGGSSGRMGVLDAARRRLEAGRIRLPRSLKR